LETFLDVDNELFEENDFYQIKYEPQNYYKQFGKRTRVVGFFRDKKEYTSEFKLFKQSAQELAVRDDLRVGLVTNKDLIKVAKDKYGI
jgi:hypothetical protein